MVFRCAITTIFVTMTLCGMEAVVGAVEYSKKNSPDALNFHVETLDGQPTHLGKYQGQVVLVVNVASRCGLTPQYAALQKMHEIYGKQGLAILGFPCNQFGGQEPGSPEEIAQFCQKNYGVTFDMFSKIHVNGPGQSALYQFLTAQKTDPKGPGEVSWNFEKFLVGREGKVVARFGPQLSPLDSKIIERVKRELAKP